MRHRFPTCAWLVLLLTMGLPTAEALAQNDSSARVHLSLHPASRAVAPGGDLAVAVVLDHDPHWHTHTHDPQVPPELGDASFYIATDIVVDAAGTSGSLVAHPGMIQWPKPTTVRVAFLQEPVDYDVYSGKAVAYLPVTIPPDAQPGEATLTLKVTYQACDDRSCLAPVRGQAVTTTVRIVPADQLAGARAGGPGGGADLFSGFDASVWAKIRSGSGPVELIDFDLFGVRFTLDPTGPAGMALLLLVAGLGGLLLNFTPCVLPVVPLKVMSLSKSAGSRGRTLALGLAMSAGVVGFWLALGGAVAFIAGFSAVNELFQRPWFTVGVGVVIAVMAVGMCGLFSLRLPKFVYTITPGQESVAGSFGFGIMTAVLSTPCTAPLMGAAAAWATKQPPATTLATFAAIGSGMALPYLVLSAFPALVSKLPRTGPGSELVKQEMGLLMLAAAAYFVGVGIVTLTAEPGLPPSQLYWWPIAGFIAAAGGWLIVRTWQIAGSMPKRWMGLAVGLATIALAVFGGLHLTDPGPIHWVYYTPERFDQALAEGNIVVMDFTAEWCINCKFLEQAVLHRPEVVDLLGAPGVVPMKVDITSEANTAGTAMLKRADRVTIPLLVVFRPDGSEAFKSDAYTAGQVIQAVREARGGG